MNYQRIIQTLVRDPKMEKARELIIEVASVITRRNINKLLSGKSVPDGIRESLERIRQLMQKNALPVIKDDRDFYGKIIQPAYLELIRIGG